MSSVTQVCWALVVASVLLAGVNATQRASVRVEEVPMAVPGGMAYTPLSEQPDLASEDLALGLNSGSSSSVKKSCKAIRDADTNAKNGIYTIAPRGKPYKVNCDMSEDKGGWTHIATVASQDGEHWNTYEAWESNTAFSLEGMTTPPGTKDYKSHAYSELKAEYVYI